MQFETTYENILDKLDRIDPESYGKSRNYIDGSVSYLSPYISRGVISTKNVLDYLINKNYSLDNAEKFIQELAWRDYWQQVWIAKGDAINDDLKNEQAPVRSYEIPRAVIDACTGIEAIDSAVKDFYKTGYIHNHVRMYIASICCNIAQCHWNKSAQWMYYHLLDADCASNALSWQWVAGTNSKKKYFANQDNINKYCYSNQQNTFLDVDYESFQKLAVPDILKEITPVELSTELPISQKLKIDLKLPTLIYNFYNLDPLWHKDLHANRVLLLEPNIFEKYPVSKQSLDFIFALSKNIENIQIHTGSFSELKSQYQLSEIIYKEHPLNKHYKGTEESRDWMFDVSGYFPSFFAFWKQCKKQIKSELIN